jgi:hypothetical protein
MPALTQTIKSLDKRVMQFAAAGAALLIIAAIATPNLLRSRMAASESSRVANLHRMYASTHPQATALSDSAPASLHKEELIADADADLNSPVSGVAGATADSSSPAATDRKLVRTAALDLTVNSPADAAEQIRRMAESMGGYLEAAQIGGTKEAPTADITIRIPAARFEDAKAQIRKLAARVESEKTDAQDVTRQYVDMDARLRNLRAEETQYLTILKSAYKVTDLLQVEQKLSEVRGQIEQQQAEFQTLSKQVETVAITISLRALADTQVFGLNWHPLYELKVAARNGLEAMGDYAAAMAAILFYVPVVLAWTLTILLAAVIGWRLFRWTGRRFFDWPSPPAQKAAGTV